MCMTSLRFSQLSEEGTTVFSLSAQGIWRRESCTPSPSEGAEELELDFSPCPRTRVPNHSTHCTCSLTALAWAWDFCSAQHTAPWADHLFSVVMQILLPQLGAPVWARRICAISPVVSGMQEALSVLSITFHYQLAPRSLQINTVLLCHANKNQRPNPPRRGWLGILCPVVSCFSSKTSVSLLS